MKKIMNGDDLIKLLKKNSVLILPEESLREILSLDNLKILQQDETHISGKIRILGFNRNIILQEVTLKNELSLRKMKNMKIAQFFIQERLNTYEKMWDGCGCKVDYYH